MSGTILTIDRDSKSARLAINSPSAFGLSKEPGRNCGYRHQQKKKQMIKLVQISLDELTALQVVDAPLSFRNRLFDLQKEESRKIIDMALDLTFQLCNEGGDECQGCDSSLRAFWAHLQSCATKLTFDMISRSSGDHGLGSISHLRSRKILHNIVLQAIGSPCEIKECGTRTIALTESLAADLRRQILDVRGLSHVEIRSKQKRGNISDFLREPHRHQNSMRNNTKRVVARPPPHLVEELMVMGFPEEWCVMALNEKENDVINASTWIVDNLDLLSSMDEGTIIDDGIGNSEKSYECTTRRDASRDRSGADKTKSGDGESPWFIEYVKSATDALFF